MLNHIIMGRLTRDPELRRTGSGIAVTSFTLAVDRDFKSNGSEKETDFIECVAWRNTGEYVGKYFSRGRLTLHEVGDGTHQPRIRHIEELGRHSKINTNIRKFHIDHLCLL